MEESKRIDYPDILFKIDGKLYSINSQNVLFISPMPKYNRVPGAAEGVIGIMKFREQIVPLVDLRILFGIPTLQQEYGDFVQMIDDRKGDHVRWVNELERCMNSGDKFTLATDPHKCAFGKWYDNFETDSHSVSYHMKKVEEPHRKLHEAAGAVQSCSQDHDACKRNVCLKETFQQVKEEYMPQVLGILEEAKDIFKATYNEMVIVIEKSDTRVGLVMDEVLAIENLEETPTTTNALTFNRSEFISIAKQKEGEKELVLELDDEQILYKYSDAGIMQNSKEADKLNAAEPEEEFIA